VSNLIVATEAALKAMEAKLAFLKTLPFKLSGHTKIPANHKIWAQLGATPQAAVTGPVDLSSFMPPARSQGDDESCTSFAGEEVASTLTNIAFGQSLQFSSEFIWTTERQAEGTFGQNTGCSIADDLSTLVNVGDCLLATMPDALGNYSDPIPDAAVAEAGLYKLTAPASVDYSNYDQVNAVFAAQKPILLGIDVYEALFSAVGPDGILDAPANPGQLAGGHAIVDCGYRSDGRRIWAFRSWQNFGANGFVFIDPGYAQQLVNSSLTASAPASIPPAAAPVAPPAPAPAA
jgi:hypothetical protein